MENVDLTSIKESLDKVEKEFLPLSLTYDEYQSIQSILLHLAIEDRVKEARSLYKALQQRAIIANGYYTNNMELEMKMDEALSYEEEKVDSTVKR